MKIPKKIINDLKQSIKHCRNCFFSNEIDLDSMYISLREYLYEIDCPEKYFQYIDGEFECDSCGSKIDLDDDIVLPTVEEEEYDCLCDEIEKDYKHRLDSFYSHLVKYPYLGLEHEVGSQIANDIKLLKLITIKNQLFYRARKKEGTIKYTKKDMHPPNSRKIKINEGRFNHYGQSLLYLGSSENVCSKEIKINKKHKCWMQKVRITSLDNILDLSNLFAPGLPEACSLVFSSINYTGIITKPVKHDASWKPEYFISRFIADIAKKNGINGIIYKSSVEFGNNLVVFDFKKGNVKYIGEPYLFRYKRVKSLF